MRYKADKWFGKLFGELLFLEKYVREVGTMLFHIFVAVPKI